MAYLRRKPISTVLISEINPTHDRYKIKVQIIKLWNGMRNNKIISIEMVLVDQVGTRIHATVEEALVEKFEKELVEDRSICLTNFTFVDYTSNYRTNPLPFKIQFYRRTVVAPCEDFTSNIPEKYLANFTEILSGKLNRSVLVDVLGQVVSTGHLESLQTQGRPNFKLNVYLRDITNVRLTCTLWGDYAKQFNDYVSKNEDQNILCLIRFAWIKEWRENYSLSNSFNSTRVLFDPKSSEAESFQSFLPKDNLISTRTDNNQLSFISSVSIEDEFNGKNPKKRIKSIISSAEAGKFVTVGIVKDIDRRKWYYIACNKCDKTVDPCEDILGYEGPPLFDCLVCGEDVSDVSARYRIVMHVSDDNEYEAKFVVFNRVAELFLKHKAAELADEVFEAEPGILPEALQNLVGKELIFKIGVTDDNLKKKKPYYVVEIISDDQEWIDKFYELQISSQQPVEVTPESSSTVLTNKRDLCSDSDSEELSTKMAKKVKTTPIQDA